jgi:hypothetical protein
VTATTTVQAQSLHSGSASGHNKQELAVQIVT